VKEILHNNESGSTAPPVILKDYRTHASRTMMFRELELLLEAVPADGSPEDYSGAVLEENVLLKGAATTRVKSLRHLRELYVLDKREPLFGALRVLWDYDPPSRRLLALLAAVTRDSLLRSTAQRTVETPTGAPVNAETLSNAVVASFPDLLAPGILAKVGRNTASSWTQSGHLQGRVSKVRAPVRPSVGAVAYALFLGHLSGVRGLPLYETLWARLLDASDSEIDALAFAASQRGWLEYRRIGEVADIGFSMLLRRGEGRLGGR
jgi:hypothetical protein